MKFLEVPSNINVVIKCIVFVFIFGHAKFPHEFLQKLLKYIEYICSFHCPKILPTHCRRKYLTVAASGE